jgi:Zn-dependent peptidase ImmA (M78 family)/transcriptional regulator with XRE-family HTH domain
MTLGYTVKMAATANLHELGLRLRRRRSEAGLTEEQLGALAGLNSTAVRSFEAGLENLGAAHLLRVARALGVPASQLLSVRSPEVAARAEPKVLLRSLGLADLHDADEELMAQAIRRAASFVELGKLLRVGDLTSRFKPQPASAVKPYLSGYRLAEEVRNELAASLGDGSQALGPIRSLRRLVEDRFNMLVVTRSFSVSRLQGAAARSGEARVMVLSKELRFESTRRFIIAHELAHHLFDLGSDGAAVDADLSGGFLIDKPPEEKRANAFAAMLLMPEADVRKVLGPPLTIHSIDTARSMVNRLRSLYGGSPEATAWHMLNLRYLADDEMVREVVACSWSEEGGFEDEPVLDGLERRAAEAVSRDMITVGKAREFLGLPADAPIPGLE